MIGRRAKIIAGRGALVGQIKNVVEGVTLLRQLLGIFGRQGDILQTVHDLIRAHRDRVERIHALEQVTGVLQHLHRQIHVQDRDTRLIVEVAHHRATGHMRRAVEADVDLALEALTQQAVSNGGQIVDPLTDAHLRGAAAGSGGTGIEIRQAGQNQTVAGFCHFQGIGLADSRLAVQREAAVHFNGSYRNDDDVIAFQISFYFTVQHLGKNARTKFHD